MVRTLTVVCLVCVLLEIRGLSVLQVRNTAVVEDEGRMKRKRGLVEVY